jgi:predicted MFS family arabinose efflux permease
MLFVAPEPPTADQSELRRHWRVLLAAVLGNSLASGILVFYTIGIFSTGLREDFGWSNSFIFSGVLLYTLTTLIAAPLAGRLSDRFGVRRIAPLSALLLSPAIMAFALNDGSRWLYAAAWILMSFIGAGTSPVTWSRAINNHFEKHKGLALGISLVGSGLMASALKPLGFWLAENWGWRGGFAALGIFPLVSALAGWILLAPRSGSSSAAPETTVPPAYGRTFADAVRTPHLWLMVAGVTAMATVVGGILPHIETIVERLGFSGGALLTIVSVMGLATAAGRLSSAYLIDRFWAPGVASLFLFTAAGVMLLAPSMPPQLLLGIVTVAVIGATAGMEIDVAAFLVARYFGHRSYGIIYGVIFAGYSVGVGLGSIIFGALLESEAGVRTIFSLSAAMLIGGAVALLLLGAYHFPLRGLDRRGVGGNKAEERGVSSIDGRADPRRSME